jgi:hypothetical protein
MLLFGPLTAGEQQVSRGVPEAQPGEIQVQKASLPAAQLNFQWWNGKMPLVVGRDKLDAVID